MDTTTKREVKAFAPTTPATHEQVLAPILPAIAQRAQEADRLRHIPDATIADLRSAGLFKLYQPARWGGHEADPRIFFALQNSIAERCASTAWVFGVLCVQALVVSLFSARAQEDVWGADSTSLTASSFAPVGRATPVDGGYRLTGRWSFASGCRHAQWALLGARVEGISAPRLFLVPCEDFHILDVWQTFGLRGTGSNDIVVSDVIVPEHRCHVLDPGIQTIPLSARPGPSLYRLPWLYLFTAGISNLAIGTGRAALRAFVEFSRTRISPMNAKGAAEDPSVHAAVARLAAEIDTIEAMYARHVEMLTQHAASDVPMPLAEGWRLRVQLTSALRSITALVDDLMLLQGARAINLDSPVARAWLDLSAARAHIGNDPTVSQAMLGAALMQG